MWVRVFLYRAPLTETCSNFSHFNPFEWKYYNGWPKKYIRNFFRLHWLQKESRFSVTMQIPSSAGCAGTIYTILSVLTAYTQLSLFSTIFSTPLQLTNCADAENDKGVEAVQNGGDMYKTVKIKSKSDKITMTYGWTAIWTGKRSYKWRLEAAYNPTMKITAWILFLTSVTLSKATSIIAIFPAELAHFYPFTGLSLAGASIDEKFIADLYLFRSVFSRIWNFLST